MDSNSYSPLLLTGYDPRILSDKMRTIADLSKGDDRRNAYSYKFHNDTLGTARIGPFKVDSFFKERAKLFENVWGEVPEFKSYIRIRNDDLLGIDTFMAVSFLFDAIHSDRTNVALYLESQRTGYKGLVMALVPGSCEAAGSNELRETRRHVLQFMYITGRSIFEEVERPIFPSELEKRLEIS